MIKKLVCAILFACVVFNSDAQLVVAEECHLNEGDLTARKLNNDEPFVEDGDTIPYAIVRVGLVEPVDTFESRGVLKTVYDGNEYKVYLQDGVKTITIKTKRYAPLRYKFPVPIEALSTYSMTIHKPANDKTNGTLHINSNVPNAVIYVDGTKVSDGTPFSYNGDSGLHTIELRAEGYNTQYREIEIPMGQEKSVTINLFSKGSLEVDGISYGLVPISAANFIMGGNLNYYTEPAHTVQLRPFSAGSTLVSFDLWEKVMEDSDPIHKGANGEVVNVTYDQCLDFINSLNEKTGGNFRLPTEAEWEYCANNSSKLGITDIQSALEWCSDWFGKYNPASAISPNGPDNGILRVVRGGSEFYENDPMYYDSTYRWRKDPETASKYISFRIVCDD